MGAYYDKLTKETIVIIDNQRLTVPDYMTLADAAYYIEEQQLKAAQRIMNEATYKTEQESPLDKARKHYKDLGWFNDGGDVHGQN
jgi:DNA polymerase elongation subunit (family B)